MARYDKYDPKDGGFRAPIAADHAKTSSGNPIGVGLNASGQIVPGAGNTGIIGILCLTSAMVAGSIVDTMTDGEVVEMSGVTAGTILTADTTTGVIGTTAVGPTKVRVGHTVEATRLVCRVNRSTIPATVVVGDQAAIADIATADAVDLATAEALANALKAKFNTLLAELRTAGVLTP